MITQLNNGRCCNILTHNNHCSIELLIIIAPPCLVITLYIYITSSGPGYGVWHMYHWTTPHLYIKVYYKRKPSGENQQKICEVQLSRKHSRHADWQGQVVCQLIFYQIDFLLNSLNINVILLLFWLVVYTMHNTRSVSESCTHQCSSTYQHNTQVMHTSGGV